MWDNNQSLARSDDGGDVAHDRPDVTIEAAPKTTWWALNDDLILLTQASTDRPFLAGRGLMAAWDATAASINQVPGFGRPHVNGKKASSRFSKPLEAHRLFMKLPKYKSGSAENDTPKIKLLDEIVALIDDHYKAKVKENMSKKTARSESDELVRPVREPARGAKRPRTSIAASDDDDDDPAPSHKRTDAQFQLRVMEIELERERIELEKAKLQMQSDQLDKDRAERTAIRQMDATRHSEMMAMMKTLLEQMQARQ